MRLDVTFAIYIRNGLVTSVHLVDPYALYTHHSIHHYWQQFTHPAQFVCIIVSIAINLAQLINLGHYYWWCFTNLLCKWFTNPAQHVIHEYTHCPVIIVTHRHKKLNYYWIHEYTLSSLLENRHIILYCVLNLPIECLYVENVLNWKV